MLAGLLRHSQSALRQTSKTALSPRIIATPRCLHTSPTAAAVPGKSGHNISMVPGSTYQKPPPKRPARKVQEDEGWQQIFAPLVRKFLKSDDASGSGITSAEAEQVWKDKEKHYVSTLPQPPGPYAGRTVQVQKEGFFTAFLKVMQILKNNKVRKEMIKTARHEKPGVKRRRLESERWRKRFAHEVRKKVQLVQEIRKRGA